MKLKEGDRVKVIDGYGNVIVEAVVERYADGGIVFVRECLSSGAALSYAVPISSVEPVEINTRPCLEEVK